MSAWLFRSVSECDSYVHIRPNAPLFQDVTRKPRCEITRTDSATVPLTVKYSPVFSASLLLADCVVFCVQGDKDFTPAAAQVAHQKPQPGVPKLAPVQHIKQQIHQPRK